ncbi:MAG: LysM peptidoglycan-binding domain-containing protein, partial [Alphaproteobacteria bacterium]
IGRTEADAAGLWRLSPDVRIKPGLYTLRADQVDNAGKVAARVSMPFSRAEPMGETPPEPFVIVQPGNSLWRLARRAYGEGVRYTTIFEANQEQIKDPDLIYPGQVFALPATN